ncbi:unnamed protein product [Chironomus riparius]|uniref:TIL domain-containing protein n=1 Tax=Chironomus riparius TaxID=315576 RepID=A0A9N9WW06_9DIPT|nr:unnamed protein product [Chironomus riparius]
MKVFAAFIFLILFPCYFCSFTCDKICTKNQVYSSKVSQCQNTCWNRKFNETSKCQTSPGCVCKNGFLRHPDTYECVSEHLCPKQTNHAQCGKNEVYLICTSNFIGCEKTCDTRKEDSKKCLCKSGCTCKNGYKRSSVTFQCIPFAECETCPSGYKYDTSTKKCTINCAENVYACPKNQTFMQCGSKCRESKCLSHKNESLSVCTQECIAGCYCDNRKGYKRDLVTNKCVLSTDCSQCPENEKIECGNPLCVQTCATIDEKCTKFPIRCEYKCYCIDGFIRAFEDSQCVSRRQCPIINKEN